MGFTFDNKPNIEIDGKRYICDPTDVNLIEGISEHFPRILAIGAEFKALQAEMIDRTKSSSEIKEKSDKFLKKNRELLLECQKFIYGTLGVEEYNEIFSGRKPNSVEHLKLCTYIFNTIMTDRAEVIKEYMDLPEREDVDASNTTPR